MYRLPNSFFMNTFSPHGPITGLKKAHYKGKRRTRVGGRGDPRPKPTKLHFNFLNPNRGGPYNLIPMRKSVYNGFRIKVVAQTYHHATCTCKFEYVT